MHACHSPGYRTFLLCAVVFALVAAAYIFGAYVEAVANQREWDRHLSDDSIDSETISQICTPRQEPR